MLKWYRCRAKVGDGQYTSYWGPDIAQALNSLDKHPWAKEVAVERFDGDGWTVITGIWR